MIFDNKLWHKIKWLIHDDDGDDLLFLFHSCICHAWLLIEGNVL